MASSIYARGVKVKGRLTTHKIEDSDFAAFLEEVSIYLEEMNKHDQQTFISLFDNSTCHMVTELKTT